jgi:hypothetical protein
MAVSIRFYPGLAAAGGFGAINDLAGSGVGFFGPGGFAAGVNVNSYQTRSFVCDATGTIQGPECNNITYLNTASGVLGSAGPTGSGTHLLRIPNYQSTLRIALESDTVVRTQNARFTIYDRILPGNPPSGVTVKVAEIIHPSMLQTDLGSGSPTWNTFTPASTGVYMNMMASPGSGGLSPAGPLTTDYWHHWHLALSASPDTVGAKTQFGAYFSTEYL